jgi:hypothetical protein
MKLAVARLVAQHLCAAVFAEITFTELWHKILLTEYL